MFVPRPSFAFSACLKICFIFVFILLFSSFFVDANFFSILVIAITPERIDG